MTATTSPEIIPIEISPDAIAPIPAEITAIPQWVCARIERVGDRLNKIPICPRTGDAASSTDPATWGTFAAAVDRARRDRLAIGFVLTEAAGIVGIDLDHVRDPDTGVIAPEALAIVAAMDSYTESSISGTGLRILARGRKPGTRCKNPTRGIEIYSAERFLVMTGARLPDARPGIEDRPEAIAALYAELFPTRATRTRPAPAAAPVAAEDREILERCRQFRGSGAFDALHAGDNGAFASASEADLSYVGALVYAGADDDQIDRIFRASGRMRDKWLRDDYRTDTLAKARAGGAVGTWGPPARTIPAPSLDENTELPDDIAELKAIIRRLTAELAAERAARLALEDRVTTIAAVQSRNAGILRNRSLGAERQTAVAVANILANKETAEATPDGMHPIYLAAVAEAAGVSTDAAARHLDRLAEMDTGLRKETRSIRTERGIEKRVFIGIEDGCTVIDFAARVAAAKPETERNGWGGRRVSCPSCGPETAIEKRTEMICTGCGDILATRREILMPHLAASGAEDEIERVATVAERVAEDEIADQIEAGAVNRHLAVSGMPDPVDALGYRAEPEHDPEAEDRERRRRLMARRRDARRFLDILRRRDARPRLVSGALMYDENAVSERVQGEIAEVRAEIEELLAIETARDELRQETAKANPRRLVFGETDRHLDRWTDPAISRAG